MSHHDIKTVPCRICTTPTDMTGTKLCDRCWELERRIRQSPDIARKILLGHLPADTVLVFKDGNKWAVTPLLPHPQETPVVRDTKLEIAVRKLQEGFL